MRTAEPKQECIETLRLTRPEVAISVTREIDEHFVWDGDGEDPALDGYQACHVTVTASTIVKGTMYTGGQGLGGSYFKPDEPCADVNGYLPGLVGDAIDDLDQMLAAIKEDDHA